MATKDILKCITVISISSISSESSAQNNGYYAFVNVDCHYVVTAFEDEKNYRKTFEPPPDPNSLTTRQTLEISAFLSGVLTGINAISSLSDTRQEPYNVYPPGLPSALEHIKNFCVTYPTKTLIDGVYSILMSEKANPIKRD